MQFADIIYCMFFSVKKCNVGITFTQSIDPQIDEHVLKQDSAQQTTVYM